MSTVEFRLLGPLEVWADSTRIPLGGPRQEHVLATLLLEANRVVPLSRLVQAAWEEDPPPTAQHQIRKTVADLRRRLPDGDQLIRTDGPGYRIAIRDELLDLRMFERYLARAKAAEEAGLPVNAVTQLRAALDLWRGSALSGMRGMVLRPAATQLEEQRIAAVERLTGLRLAMGDAGDLVGELQSLVNEHPLRERLVGLYMTALYQSGRQAEALQAYIDARGMLSDQLGIDPSVELSKRYEQILRNDPELDVRAQPPPAAAVPDAEQVQPTMLPHDLSDFTGQATTLQTVLDAAGGSGGHALTVVSVNGMAGVGKTTLAIHAAHRLAARFPDGQLFLDLNGFTQGREPIDPFDALGVLLRALGVPGEQLTDDIVGRSALWRARTTDRALLVLLDNARSAAQVRPLLPGSADCLVLITSRAQLTGLDGADSISLEPPSDEEAAAMVTRLLGNQQRVTPEETAALIDACGRLPLALRIAAARLRNRPKWTLEYLVGRMRREGRLLGELVVDDRSVAAAIGLSYHGVGTDHQRMFRLLGLFPGDSWDAYTAAAIAGVSLDRAENILEDLLDAQLLIQRQLDRYEMHDLVRSYTRTAAAKDNIESDLDTAVRRLLDYYTHTADAAADRVQPERFQVEITIEHPPRDAPEFASQAEALAWFDSERRNLFAAFEYATRNGLDFYVCHLPRVMAFWLYVRGEMHEQLEAFRQAAAAAQRLGEHVHERLNLINLAIAYWYIGEFHQALDRYCDALAIAEEMCDVAGEGVCLGRIGTACASLGRLEEAMSYQQRALAIHRTTASRAEEGNALTNISYVQTILGQYTEAEGTAMQAVTLLRDRAQPGDVAGALARRAAALSGLGDHDTALACLQDALTLTKGTNSRNIEAMLMTRYAEIYRRQGHLLLAEEHALRALELLWAIQRPAIAAEAENLLGAVYRDRRDYAASLARHQNAREIAERIGLRIELARSLDGMAHAEHGLGDHAAARDYWEQSLAHHTAMGTPETDFVRGDLNEIARH